MDLGELGAVLRLHRGRIQPADVGSVHGPRRSVPGLRRSEVARLAGASPGYYAALERGAGGRPSEMVLAALARALRLDDDDDARCRALAARREGFAQRLHWYTPIPGTDAGDKLGLLAVLGLQDLDDGT